MIYRVVVNRGLIISCTRDYAWSGSAMAIRHEAPVPHQIWKGITGAVYYIEADSFAMAATNVEFLLTS